MAKGWQMREKRYKNTIRAQKGWLRTFRTFATLHSKRVDQLEATIKALVKRKRAAEHIGELR